jgi:hypothetical protein
VGWVNLGIGDGEVYREYVSPGCAKASTRVGCGPEASDRAHCGARAAMEDFLHGRAKSRSWFMMLEKMD